MPFKPQRDNKSFRGKSRGNYRGKGRGFRRPQNQNKKAEYRHQDQLNEEDVGITEFINKFEGFSGVIKARFSDFQVNEISLDGTLAKLTDRSFPKDFQTKLQEVNFKEINETPIKEIPQDKWDQIRSLLQKSENSDKTLKAVELDVAELDKECRKKIHDCLKKYFGQKVVANTKTEDQKAIMEIKRYDKEDSLRINWPSDKGEYVHFLVYKEIMDTMEASLLIGERLRIKPSQISYAGVKDRRAKTTQWMCIRKIFPFKLITRMKGVRQVVVGNVEFKDKPLKIGDLSGNKFRIAVRNVQAEDSLINKSLEFIKKNGFVNYYGLQRFGNDKEVPTYLIGTKLLSQKWSEAVDLILKVKSSDDPDYDLSKAKKKYQETKNAKQALELLNGHTRSLEAKLLDGLSKHNSADFVNSLESVPRNTRLMYIHSFQSLVWNKMASKRIQEFGFKPVEGDLVLIEENAIDPELIRDLVEKKEDDESDSEESKKSSEKTQKSAEENETETENRNRQKVKTLTADDLEKYTIYDVVLPLPGYDVEYPENLKASYKQVVEEHDLSLEMPQHKVRTYNLSGAYRKLMGKAKDMSWKIMYFDDPTKNLIRSDLEELNGEKEPENVENGKYKALVLEFDLKPSSYATMILREVMKCNTSSSIQAQLNYYAETKQNETSNISKILENDNQTTNGNRVENEVPADSLLADKAKYEIFMNSILGETTENEKEGEADSLKANNEKSDPDEPESKKVKISNV